LLTEKSFSERRTVLGILRPGGRKKKEVSFNFLEGGGLLDRSGELQRKKKTPAATSVRERRAGGKIRHPSPARKGSPRTHRRIGRYERFAALERPRNLPQPTGKKEEETIFVPEGRLSTTTTGSSGGRGSVTRRG